MRVHKSVKCGCYESDWPTHYCEKHDSFYCPDCDVWIETACSDPTCEYCVDRPEKPSMVEIVIDTDTEK